MIRFLWLALSLMGWGLVFHFLPRLPPYVLLLPSGVSLIGYLYGWIVHKRNWLIHFCSLQLHRLIQQGKGADQCMAEWRRRWGMDYPWYRDISGVRSYVTGERR